MPCPSLSHRVEALTQSFSFDFDAKHLCSYVLFSIGNIRPLLAATFPECWKDHTICSKTWIESVEYLEICGIIVGMLNSLVVSLWLLGMRSVLGPKPYVGA